MIIAINDCWGVAISDFVFRCILDQLIETFLVILLLTAALTKINPYFHNHVVLDIRHCSFLHHVFYVSRMGNLCVYL